ncbi:glycerol kinase [Salinihabitans flavidus]|uniref:Glycerol kinase n=1 Tax=Salinihabitans flavidus TaxID=569882 RepID=A0A1H8QJZ0_9RHOB|nr:glycerol kinase GlpK [Salinihabitans flavidus]SEO54529.1 glycerol kinase [Salinihabitans flavidus]
MTHILAIDQGTTSSRAILFDGDMRPVASAQREFTQHFPRTGWIEHDPEEIWQGVLATCREVMDKTGVNAAQIAGIGITNQRETTVLWDRETGRPLHSAIVWQDRRTAGICHALHAGGHESRVNEVTGLLLDPYFSATKIRWILDQIDGGMALARQGKIAFGTIDSWLIWKLTGGAVHATDATNAARTMLFDIHKGKWSEEMCALFGIPDKMLADVCDCAGDFGTTEAALFGAPIPIRGVAGDQQAATIGQACFAPGMMKATYGTGCFALLNTGERAVRSQNRLLTTIAYQIDGKRIFALEGAIFNAGTVVQWLRDGLGLITTAAQTQALAEAADRTQDLILVPAFTGLGAPYWAPECRGAIFGLTRNSGPAEFARAALESVGFQTRDLLEAMQADMGVATAGEVLRVDGGMTVSDWTMQFLADVIGAPVDRPEVAESTALGAAWLAGMRAGVYPDMDGFARGWRLDRRFEPEMQTAHREERYAAWKTAVAAVLSTQTGESGLTR